VIGIGYGEVGLSFQQAFVDTPKFLSVQIAVRDATRDLINADPRQVLDSLGERAIAEQAGIQVRACLGLEQTAAEAWYPQGGVLAGDKSEGEPERAPEIIMTIVGNVAARYVTQATGGVQVAVQLFDASVGAWLEDKVAFFGGKQENQPVHEAEELAVVIAGV